MVDIVVRGGEGVPEGAYLSLRVGDVRRQMHFKPGSHFRFESGVAPPRSFSIDVFEKVASTQVGFGDLQKRGGARCKEGSVEVPRSDGGLMTLDVEASPLGKWELGEPEAWEKPKATVHPDVPPEVVQSTRQKAASQARGYLHGHEVQKLLGGMVQTLLVEQPEDPLLFMIRYLQAAAPGRPEEPPPEVAGREEAAEDQACLSHSPSFLSRGSPCEPQLASLAESDAEGQSCGQDEESVEDEECGFPVALCPETLPDLGCHWSLTAALLRNCPIIYHRLRDVRTALGVSLARCIKPGMDVRGHPLVPTIGAVAGDAECYEAFAEFFDPLAAELHGVMNIRGLRHPCDIDSSKVTGAPIDPSGQHILGVRVQARRNLSGMRMAPACSREERRQAESLLVQALCSAQGDLSGTYYPLAGSESHSGPSLSTEDETWLDRERLLLEEPDSDVDVASGFSREWPDARGLFVTKNRGLVAMVNEEDHISLSAMDSAGDLKKAFALVCLAHNSLEESLRAAGHEFAFSERLGFLSVSPARLGTCLAVGVVLRLPELGKRKPELEALCAELEVRARPHLEKGESFTPASCKFEFSLGNLLGTSEAAQTAHVHQACSAIVALERRLAAGEEVDLQDPQAALGPLPPRQPSPASSPEQPSTPPPPMPVDEYGDEEEYASEGPDGSDSGSASEDDSDASDYEEPDLERHNSVLADVLQNDRSIFGRLQGQRTGLGVSLARCIKPGVAVRGHPLIKTVGMVAGDAESYEAFWELFRPAVATEHRGWRPEAAQPMSLDSSRVSSLQLDPSGVRIPRARVSFRRNLAGLRFSPAMDRHERLEAERVLRRGLEQFVGRGSLKGEYLPVEGLPVELEEPLMHEGLLLQEPDSQLALAAGAARGWPEGRGVFLSRSHELVAWINGDDHLRLWSSDDSGDLRAAFRRLCEVEQAVCGSLQEDGHSFAHHPILGYLTTSPSHLGTALRAEVRVRLPHLGASEGFYHLCERLGLLVSSVFNSGGAWDISNGETLGSGEADQVNGVLEAVRLLLKLEGELETGQKVNLASIQGLTGST